MHTPIPLESLSFPAYYLTTGPHLAPVRSGFLSLVHYFEAEKFRGVEPSLYEDVMNSPTIREARTLAKRHQNHCRLDWLGVRSRAMVCALQYAAWADLDSARWSQAPRILGQEIIALGFPPKFAEDAATDFAKLRVNPVFVFFGIDKAPPDVLGKRVNLIHRTYLRTWTLTHWLGRHGDWRIHDWAMTQYVPIKYQGKPGDSLSPMEIDALLNISTQACVFEKRGGKELDAIVRQVKGRKYALAMELFG